VSLNSSPILAMALIMSEYLYYEMYYSEYQNEWQSHVMYFVKFDFVYCPSPGDEHHEGTDEVVAGHQEHCVEHTEQVDSYSVHSEHYPVQQIHKLTHDFKHNRQVQPPKTLVLLKRLNLTTVFTHVVQVV
jgi:hypothetical protein